MSWARCRASATSRCCSYWRALSRAMPARRASSSSITVVSGSKRSPGAASVSTPCTVRAPSGRHSSGRSGESAEAGRSCTPGSSPGRAPACCGRPVRAAVTAAAARSPGGVRSSSTSQTSTCRAYSGTSSSGSRRRMSSWSREAFSTALALARKVSRRRAFSRLGAPDRSASRSSRWASAAASQLGVQRQHPLVRLVQLLPVEPGEGPRSPSDGPAGASASASASSSASASGTSSGPGSGPDSGQEAQRLAARARTGQGDRSRPPGPGGHGQVGAARAEAAAQPDTQRGQEAGAVERGHPGVREEPPSRARARAASAAEAMVQFSEAAVMGAGPAVGGQYGHAGVVAYGAGGAAGVTQDRRGHHRRVVADQPGSSGGFQRLGSPSLCTTSRLSGRHGTRRTGTCAGKYARRSPDGRRGTSRSPRCAPGHRRCRPRRS